MPIADFFISCHCPGGLPNEKVLLNPPNKILYFWRMFHPAYVYFCPYLRRWWGPFFPKIFFTTCLNLLKCNHPDKTLRFLQWLLHCDKVLIVAVVADAYLGFWSSDTIKRLGKLMVYLGSVSLQFQNSTMYQQMDFLIPLLSLPLFPKPWCYTIMVFIRSDDVLCSKTFIRKKMNNCD